MILDRSSIRYCPKCGSGDLIRPVTGKIVCRACDFVLYFNTASAVAGLIVNDQGHLLALTRGRDPQKGTLDLPGGFVDPGENAEEAMRREAKEETGLDVTTLEYLGSEANEYPYKGFLYHTVDAIFLCHVSNTPDAQAADDAAALHWLAPDKIKVSDFGFTSIQRAVQRFLDSL